MNTERKLILISNDDGIQALGIKVLTDLMRPLADVIVVAPDSHQSGKSNAITSQEPIRVTKVEETEGFTAYACSGTPTDCVKLALNQILNRKPDMLVSGINNGSNSAINVIYSGTMGAAFEGCINHIPSIGFSLVKVLSDNDYEAVASMVVSIAQKVLHEGLPDGICLNVNFPSADTKGIRICKQTKGHWVEEFTRIPSQGGGDSFLLGGHYVKEDDATDADEFALAEGYATVVPCQIDFTAYSFIETLKTWKL